MTFQSYPKIYVFGLCWESNKYERLYPYVTLKSVKTLLNLEILTYFISKFMFLPIGFSHVELDKGLEIGVEGSQLSEVRWILGWVAGCSAFSLPFLIFVHRV